MENTRVQGLRKWKKTLLSMGMAVALVFSPLTAQAGTGIVNAAVRTASDLDELAEVVRKEAMARNGDFTVKFSGSDEEWGSLFGDRIDFFYYTLVTKDDPATSDDADYLVGNIDFSKEILQGDTKTRKLRFTLDYFETAQQTEIVNRTTARVLDELGVEGRTNYEKTKIIHDYVCRLITFEDNVKDGSSAYSAYTRGKGLCNSYALCMYKLLTEAGVPCKWIGGEAGTARDAGGHAWNLVQLGDLWYHLDATWDDKEDGITYDYFLKGSRDFDEADDKQTHKLDDEYYYTDYLKRYPIAETAFEIGMDDSNSQGTNWGQEPGVGSEQPKYSFQNLVTGKYPESGSFSLKKGKMEDIQLYVTEEALDVIDKVTYKVTNGKNFVKVKNMGFYEDDGVYFADLEVWGKKKGTAKIKVTVTLDNGQSKNYTFTVKIKK